MTYTHKHTRRSEVPRLEGSGGVIRSTGSLWRGEGIAKKEGGGLVINRAKREAYFGGNITEKRERRERLGVGFEPKPGVKFIEA